MNRRLFRAFLMSLLLGGCVFVVWTWFRPYEKGADAGARYEIQTADVSRDHSYFWVTLHLERIGDADHDLEKPVTLELGSGVRLDPAETTMEGAVQTGVTAHWFKYWLDEAQMAERFFLNLNDGRLAVKSTEGLPTLKPSGERVFTTHRW